MKLIEDFNTIPSLGFLTTSWVVTTVWNHSNITRAINKCLDNFDQAVVNKEWKEIIVQVTAIIQGIENIPNELVNDMKAMVMPIGIQIFETLNFIYSSPGFRHLKIKLPVTHWTSYGTVDTTRFEKVLVQDKRINIGFRYILACSNCFEEILKELFPLLTDEQKNDFLRVGRNRELLSYWTHRLSGDLSRFRELTEQYDEYMREYSFSADQFAFLYTLLTGSKSGIEYFFSFLTRGEYETVLKNVIYHSTRIQ